MIGIKLQGDTEYLQTNDDTSIEITLENPLLGDADKLSPGSYSMPFSLPGGDVSPSNSRKLKNPDVVANSEGYQLQKAGLFFDDVPFKSGNLKAKKTNGNNIESYFTFGLNSLNEDFKEANLRDVINEVITIDESNFIRRIFFRFNINDSEIEVTINGVSYKNDSPTVTIYHKMLADAMAAKDTGRFVPYPFGDPGNVGDGITISMAKLFSSALPPFLILDYSVDPLIELNAEVNDNSAPFDLTTFDWNDYYQGFRNYLNPYITGSYPDNKLRFPVMFNANLHEDARKQSEIINGVSASGLIINNPISKKNYNSIQPVLMLKWVLEKIADHFGFHMEGDFYEDPDLLTRLIDNSQTLDVPQKFIGTDKFIFWRRSFNISELVPDIKVVDFFKLISIRYNVGIYVNESTTKVRLKYRELIALSLPYNEITPLCSPVMNIDDLKVSGYQVSVLKEDSDDFSELESLTIGVPKDPIEIKLGRIHQLGFTGLDAGLIQGPRVSRKNGVKFGFRIFHYTGMVANSIFSYAQADIQKPTCAESLNDSADVPGLYKRFFKYWLLFQKNRQLITLQVDWPIRNLIGFDWEIKQRFDRSDFLVKSIKLKMTNRNLNVSEVELLTMK